MFLLWLFAVFVEDTVYVTSSFPYERELHLSYPSSSFYFSVENGSPLFTVFSGSLLYKDYGNLTSISFRGTRTQDLSFELEGIPLKQAQSDYVDISLFPASIIKNVVIITHPLSSYDPSMGAAGGVFAMLDTTPEVTLKAETDKTSELSLGGGRNFKLTADVAISNHALKWYKRFFGMFKSDILTMMVAQRTGGTSGPVGSGIRGTKKDFFFGYNIKFLDKKDTGFLVKGNISSLVYMQGRQKDTHTGLSNISILKINPLIFTFLQEVMFSTRAGFHIRSIPMVSLFKTFKFKNFYFALNAAAGHNLRSNRIYTTYFAGIGKNIGFFTLYFDLSRGVHFPSFMDLYWRKDAFSEGNPELREETINQREAGVKGIVKNTMFGINLFEKEVENMVQWINVLGRYKPFNIGRRRLHGIEFRIEQRIGASMYAGYSATFNTFKNILYMPHAEEGFWVGNKCCTLYLSYVGERLKRPSSLKKLPSFEIIDFHVHRSFSFKPVNVNVLLKIRNLLQEQIEWLPGFVDRERVYSIEIDIKK